MNPKPLICDSAMYCNIAARMGMDTEVAYYSSWQNAFPESREMAVGLGLPNVERVDDPITFMLQGKASHVIVPDLNLTGFANLARALQIPTFDCNGGDDIESDRWLLKEMLEDAGLPVIRSQQVEGLEALRDILEKEEDRYVKVSIVRGDMETYHHEMWEKTKPEFYRWALKFGALGEKMRFIVEDPIPDAKEVGIDTFFRHGQFVMPFFYGLEIKDGGYVGVMMKALEELNAGEQAVMNILGEHFARKGYNCFFSNEMREMGGDVYMTDATCRIPSPPGGVLMASMKNFTNFILKNEPPDYEGKVITEIILKTQAEGWVEMTVPKSMRNRVMLHNYCIVDGHTWLIPHETGFVEKGSACGWGNSINEAREMALETAKAVKCDGLYFDDHVLDKAEEVLG